MFPCQRRVFVSAANFLTNGATKTLPAPPVATPCIPNVDSCTRTNAFVAVAIWMQLTNIPRGEPLGGSGCLPAVARAKAAWTEPPLVFHQRSPCPRLQNPQKKSPHQRRSVPQQRKFRRRRRNLQPPQESQNPLHPLTTMANPAGVQLGRIIALSTKPISRTMSPPEKLMANINARDATEECIFLVANPTKMPYM